jgi:hypothetical protein
MFLERCLDPVQNLKDLMLIWPAFKSAGGVDIQSRNQPPWSKPHFQVQHTILLSNEWMEHIRQELYNRRPTWIIRWELDLEFEDGTLVVA